MSNARLKHRAGLRPKLIALSVAACFGLSTTHSAANPTGGAVSSGSASFAASGNTLTITNSANAIINWQSFSIGVNEITRFLQSSGSSAVLNRVVGANGVIPQSVIDGILSSNGRVFLLNSSGIVIGATARIDVAGFVASSLNLSDADFLTGRMRFTEVPGAGGVSNAGVIDTTSGGPGGRVFLVAPDVQNSGIIRTPQGEIVLAAGKSADLVSENSPFVTVNITADSERALNVGQLLADSGRIGMFGALVRQGGVAQANSAVLGENGEIRLVATQNVTLDAGSVTSASGGTQGGNVQVSAPVVVQAGDIRADGNAGGNIQIDAGNFLQAGTLSASGSAGAGGTISVNAPHVIQTSAAVMAADGSGGDGGSISVDASGATDGLLFSSAKYSATGDKGGNINLLGHDIVLLGAGADASGANGGGTILVGGDFQGNNPAVANAATTGVNFSTTLKADATQNGDGGKIVVWSDSNTQFYGTASARGGAQSGNGGAMEISGRDRLTMNGLADAGAPNGTPGSVLLDPKNIIIDSNPGGGGTLGSFQLVDPHPGANEQFGQQVKVLTNQNVVVTDPNDSFTATGAGAVYLFNSSTGQLISQLTGSTLNDHVGSSTITTLPSGSFLVSSPSWNNGTATAAGAVTFASGTSGVSGTVSATNSLVGSTANDQVGAFGSGITTLTSGDYVVLSPVWNNGAATQAGAVTWVNGTNGNIAGTASPGGAVSATNSLVGSTANDRVGYYGVREVNNSSYVVLSPLWNNGAATQAGAVTWVNGTNGNIAGTASPGGAVSATNSLVGSTTNDNVGIFFVTPLSGGNYLVPSSNWTNPGNGAASAGAVTLVNGANGAIVATGAFGGTVSATNSLVGSTTNDKVGSSGVMELTNGNYLVLSPNWNGGAGAVTFAIAGTPVVGAVSAANSLVGATAGDGVGNSVIPLINGNYVVASPNWDIPTGIPNVGAVTFGSETSGVSGAVSTSNSLVGSTANDRVGSSVIPLTNGNYVVSSTSWSNGAATQAGAVTWVDGTNGNIAGTTSPGGAVSATNSLVGLTINDVVGSRSVTALSNGNYVVASPNWDIPTGVPDVGAVTFGSGTTGVAGPVSAANSLVGSTASDQVGVSGVIQLTGSSNYVVLSPFWNNGPTVTLAGAATFVNGSTGLVGAVSATNSLVGSTLGDRVGATVTPLNNGDYAVLSPNWGNGGGAPSAGAVTFASGTAGIAGTVSATNSLVGSTASDQVGIAGVIQLSNGKYVVLSPNWNNGAAATSAGAVTFVSGTAGLVGTVSATNSLVGSTTSDQVGSGIMPLFNGNYVVMSPNWSNAGIANAGAATWVNGATGDIAGTASPGGAVSAANSLVGSAAGDNVGSAGVFPLLNGNYVVATPNWNNFMGAVTFGSGTVGVTGAISAANSLVGSTPSNGTTFLGDRVGSGGGFSSSVIPLPGGNYLVGSPNWANGTAFAAGAVTWVNGTDGNLIGGTDPGGAVSAANSLVGGSANDNVGTFFCDCSAPLINFLPSGNFVLTTSFWTNPATGAANAGAVTAGSSTSGITGLITSANSIVGTAPNDNLGSGGIFPLTNGNFVVSSPNAANGALAGAGLVQVVTPGAGGGGGAPATGQTFGSNSSADVTITPAAITAITNTGTVLVLQANNDITLDPASDIVTVPVSTAGGSLTLQAGRSILLNSSITTGNGNLTLVANETAANGVVDANRDPGAAAITMAGGTTLNAGTANISLTLNTGAGLTNSTSGNITLANLTTAGNVVVQNVGPTAGSGIVSAGANQLVTAASAAFDVNGAGGGGGIGTAAAPIRVALANLAARTGAGGAFFNSPSLGLNIGAAGALNGITASGAGNIQVSAAGALTQSAGATGAISTTGVLTTSSVGGTTLTGANTVNGFNATNTAGGNVAFANSSALLTVTGINEAGGNVTLSNTGGVSLAGAASAGAGAVTLISGGNITGPGSVAGGSVVLTASIGAIGSTTALLEVVTPSLAATAANGIAIDLNGLSPAPAVVNTLQNTATGDIVLNAHGGATFSTLVNNPGGNVTISTFSPLDVIAGITAGNSIFLSTGGGTQSGPANDMSLNGPYTYSTTSGAFEVTIGRGGDLTLFTGVTPMVLTAALFPNPVNITKFTFVPTDPLSDPDVALAYNTTLVSPLPRPRFDLDDSKKDKDKQKKEAAACK